MRPRVGEPAPDDADQFEAAVTTTPVIIWRSGADEVPTPLNRVWRGFAGCALEQHFGVKWDRRINPVDRDHCGAEYTRAFAARGVFELEYRLQLDNGRSRWILERGRPLDGRAGGFRGYAGVCIDLTDHKRATRDRQVAILDEALQTLFAIGLIAARALSNHPVPGAMESSDTELDEILDLAAAGATHLRSLSSDGVDLQAARYRAALHDHGLDYVKLLTEWSRAGDHDQTPGANHPLRAVRQMQSDGLRAGIHERPAD